MADIKIEDLELLQVADLDVVGDFLIVQQPNGGTFKMPIDQVFNRIADGSEYNAQNILMASYDQGGSAISQSNLFNINSSTIVYVNMQSIDGYSNANINWGDTFDTTFSIIKHKGLNCFQVSGTNSDHRIYSVGTPVTIYFNDYRVTYKPVKTSFTYQIFVKGTLSVEKDSVSISNISFEQWSTSTTKTGKKLKNKTKEGTDLQKVTTGIAGYTFKADVCANISS